MFGEASKILFLCFVQVAERISWVICDLSGNGLSLLIHRCVFTLSYPLRRTNPQASIESTSFLVWASLSQWQGKKCHQNVVLKKSSLYPKPFPLANSGKQERNGVKEMGLLYLFYFTHVYMDFPGGSDGRESAWKAGDPGLILGLGRSPGEGNGSCYLLNFYIEAYIILLIKKQRRGTSLVSQWLRLCAPHTGVPGSIPGKGTRSHVVQLKILFAATKIWRSQINI